MSGAEKHRAKKQAVADITAVQEVLRRWDPIGVIPSLLESELPPDEYDDYAPHIVSMLSAGCSQEELSGHLSYCRTGAMGLSADPGVDRAVAAELVAWWKRSR